VTVYSKGLGNTLAGARWAACSIVL
jgi:hypothetical protein